MPNLTTKRLTAADFTVAGNLFQLMADVFEEEQSPLSDAYLIKVLSRPDFWALAAYWGDELVGGITAHTLPMSRSESSELFIYDLAVLEAHQRKGIGRRLMVDLYSAAQAVGIEVMFVPADNEDEHALDFYHALGGVAAPVTIFTFDQDAPPL